jgi:hypothetical protein
MHSLVYERRVKSMSELFEELVDLDADEGVRILAEDEGRKKLVFVTRHSGRYSLGISDAHGGNGIWVPGRKMSFREFSDQRTLREFLAGLVKKPLTAYVY